MKILNGQFSIGPGPGPITFQPWPQPGASETPSARSGSYDLDAARLDLNFDDGSRGFTLFADEMAVDVAMRMRGFKGLWVGGVWLPVAVTAGKSEALRIM